MNIKVQECEFGTIEYRLPNIPEAMMLLGYMGLSSANIDQTAQFEENEFIYIGKMIKNMGFLIEKINITIEEKKISEYNELIYHFCMMDSLGKIASEIMQALDMGEANKKK